MSACWSYGGRTSIVGCPLLGFISDRIGRRKPVIVGGGVRGVVSGDFSDVSAAGASAEQVALDAARLQRLWQEFFLPLNVPVLAGWRSGHVDPNLTLPIGAVVTLDADRQGVRVEQALVV